MPNLGKRSPVLFMVHVCARLSGNPLNGGPKLFFCNKFFFPPKTLTKSSNRSQNFKKWVGSKSLGRVEKFGSGPKGRIGSKSSGRVEKVGSGRHFFLNFRIFRPDPFLEVLGKKILGKKK